MKREANDSQGTVLTTQARRDQKTAYHVYNGSSSGEAPLERSATKSRPEAHWWTVEHKYRET